MNNLSLLMQLFSGISCPDEFGDWETRRSLIKVEDGWESSSSLLNNNFSLNEGSSIVSYIGETCRSKVTE